MSMTPTKDLIRQSVSRQSPLLLLLLAFVACDRGTASGHSAQVHSLPPQQAAEGALALPADDDEAWRKPSAPRVVAIGDVHGDLTALRVALKLVGAIDDTDNWIGGELVVVQTGDLLDRGDDERQILDLVERLQREASAAGGGLHVLNGNHETMNVQGDFRYVTERGYTAFADIASGAVPAAELERFAGPARGRAAAFLPGGSYARKLARHPVVLAVGDSLFVHGGVLPEHVRYGLAKLNRETADWMLGKGPLPPLLRGPDAPVWSRHFSDGVPGEACEVLTQVLQALKLKRLVVGHTVQQNGITAACGERVWRIDVGMAHHYGGKPAALEIQAGKARPIQ